MSVGHKHLIGQIVDTLRLDVAPTVSLVALTGHTATDARIARSKPPVVGKLPFLGVSVFNSIPLIPKYATQVQIARVMFTTYCAKSSETLTMDIADRMCDLLNNTTGSTRAFYDFSGGDISNRETRYVSRDEHEFDDKLDVWKSVVEADITWVNESCS